MKEEETVNQWLLDDIAFLKKRGIIERDIDIVNKTGYDKSTLSNYISGRIKASRNFKEKFYEVFNLQTLRMQVSEGIPIYELRASASGIESFHDEKEIPAFSVQVPGYEDCNFGMYVYGHSMYPTIENGALILCRKITDKNIILYGEIYVIVTKDYRMVKRLQKSEIENSITCISDNGEDKKNGDRRYESIELNTDKILNLYIVKGIIKKTQS